LQLSAHLTRSTRPDLTPITYHREYRLALGEKFEVVGAFVNDLKLGESVVAQVTQVN
jgi:hypothetical protein